MEEEKKWRQLIKITARTDNGAGKPDVEIELLDDSAHSAYFTPLEAFRFAECLRSNALSLM